MEIHNIWYSRDSSIETLDRSPYPHYWLHNEGYYATMLAGDRSRGAISPASILSESRNYLNCVHWRIFYFMWLRRIYEFFCVHSNPIWKGWNYRDYRPSNLIFREYFRLFWFSRSCVVVAYCNWRMRSSNVQGFVSRVLTLYEEEEE